MLMLSINRSVYLLTALQASLAKIVIMKTEIQPRISTKCTHVCKTQTNILPVAFDSLIELPNL